MIEIVVALALEASKHRAQRRAKRIYYVACEYCRTEYVYVLRRTGKGGALQSERAEDEAEDDLHEKLRNASDLVPCPCCFYFQKHMFEESRDEMYSQGEHGGTLIMIGGALLCPFAILLAIFRINQMDIDGYAMIISILLSPFFGFFLRRGALRRRARYDPNATDEAYRARVARRRATRLADFQARVAEQNRAAYTAAAAKVTPDRPFPVAVWVTRQQLRERQQVSVSLPCGESVRVALKKSFRHNDLYRLTTADGRPSPFAIWVQVLWRTRCRRGPDA